MASLSIKNKNSNGDGNSRLDDFWKKWYLTQNDQLYIFLVFFVFC